MKTMLFNQQHNSSYSWNNVPSFSVCPGYKDKIKQKQF